MQWQIVSAAPPASLAIVSGSSSKALSPPSRTGCSLNGCDQAAALLLLPVPLGGEAGNVRYDPSSDRVLVDVQTANQVAVIEQASASTTSASSRSTGRRAR